MHQLYGWHAQWHAGATYLLIPFGVWVLHFPFHLDLPLSQAYIFFIIYNCIKGFWRSFLINQERYTVLSPFVYLFIYFFFRNQMQVANLSITNEFIPIQAAAVTYLAWGFLCYVQHIGFSCLYFFPSYTVSPKWMEDTINQNNLLYQNGSYA